MKFQSSTIRALLLFALLSTNTLAAHPPSALGLPEGSCRVLKIAERRFERGRCGSLSTFRHTLRVSLLAGKLAEQLGWSTPDVLQARVLGLLHDLGKSRISTKVLDKRSRPTDEEFGMLKLHARWGTEIFGRFDSSVLPPGTKADGLHEAILYHHERWDGKGYEGLSKEAIPPLARLITVVDSFEAMTSKRLRRTIRDGAGNERVETKPVELQTARDELRRNAGSQFDERMTKAFEKVIDEIVRAGGLEAYWMQHGLGEQTVQP